MEPKTLAVLIDADNVGYDCVMVSEVLRRLSALGQLAASLLNSRRRQRSRVRRLKLRIKL